MMISDKSAIQDETEQKLDEADQAAATFVALLRLLFSATPGCSQ